MRDHASDIPVQSWVSRFLPRTIQPYARLARLDRPIGTWLLLLPGWWGLAMTASSLHPAMAYPNLYYMALFGIGALVMRGAGCTWNDITDRDFDGRVARTADRPIPAGDVTVKQALAFLGLQLAIGLVILLQFNPFAWGVGAAALFLVVTYPFMKRITYWPQAWLGLTFNWGALLSWAAMEGEIALPALLLYAAGFFWTMGYDTIYAHQDKEDDALIGVKSTALKLGRSTPYWVIGFYSLTLILLGLAATAAQLSLYFWPFFFAGAVHLGWQVRNLNIDDHKLCLKLFKSNRDFGLIVLAAMIAGGF